MHSENSLSRRASLGEVTRRDLLIGATAFAASRPVYGFQRGGRDTTLAYVGCYTPNSLGINLFRVESDGDLTPIKVFTSPPGTVAANSPSWIAFNPGKTHLYAANEISNFSGPSTTGAVSAFSVNQANGDLTFLNSESSQGTGPAHLSVDPFAEYVLVSNYGGGNCAVLPIRPRDGSLGPATDMQLDVNTCAGSPCLVGPTRAEKAPPGSFAISGHNAPHAHMIETDPTGKFAIATDLGLDIVIIWQFDRVNGKLLTPKTFPTSAGAGPRHFAFHPNGVWFYLLNEESSTLSFAAYNSSNGSLQSLSEVEISTLPEGFVGTNFTSEIMVSPNGSFIYVANRLHDTIAIFSIERNGHPELIDEEWTRGDYPRSFNIDPSGRYMYVCNQRSDAVTTFKVDGNGRRLKFADRYTPVGSPACIIFL
jgi:6-phosphogluconolactonase (cycloisomerase 2 family)